MNKPHKIYYLTPALLAVIVFASNFLSTDLFQAGYQNFSVWFVLSVFAFACGWLINKTLGYVLGGKILFAVIVSTAFFSVLMILFFSAYFGLNDLLVENLVLYILRNIVLGAMGYFGMAVSEVVELQKENRVNQERNENFERQIVDSERQASLILDEAKLKAEKIIQDAQKSCDEIIARKNSVEMHLKEFIAAEKDLIKRYEKEENF